MAYLFTECFVNTMLCILHILMSFSTSSTSRSHVPVSIPQPWVPDCGRHTLGPRISGSIHHIHSDVGWKGRPGLRPPAYQSSQSNNKVLSHMLTNDWISFCHLAKTSIPQFSILCKELLTSIAGICSDGFFVGLLYYLFNCIISVF